MNSGSVYGPTIAVVVVIIIIVVLVLILVLRQRNDRPLQTPTRINKGLNSCLHIVDNQVSMQLNDCTNVPINSLQRQFQLNGASQLTVISQGNGIACVRANTQTANTPVVWTGSCMPDDATLKWQVINNRIAPLSNTNNLCIDADTSGNAILANCDNVLPFTFDPVNSPTAQ